MSMSDDSLHGVDVVGETEILVTNDGGFFEWIGYGLRLSILENSLPAGMEMCRINIKASLSGLFQLPDDSDLLSPVFWISTPVRHARSPVTLEIQHCASNNKSNLSFISTKFLQENPPYIFTPLTGGRFTAGNSYGSIQLSHFCGVGITGRNRAPRSYCAQIYTIKEESNEWKVVFIITQYLDIPQTLLRDHYGTHILRKRILMVRFEHSEISLDIPEEGQVTSEGWRITPCTCPTISKMDADSFKPPRCIPGCELLVEWVPTDQNQKLVPLRYKVNLIGAKAPCNYFYLILNPAWKGSVHADQIEQKLDMKDFTDITKYFRGLVEKAAVCNLGLELGIHYNRLKTMMDSPMFLQDVLAAWLKQVDQVQQRGAPTWKRLVTSLRRIGQNGIATNIEHDKQITEFTSFNLDEHLNST